MPARHDLAKSAHDSAPIRPEGGDPRHASDADDLWRDDLLVSWVHQLVRPVQLVAPDPEAKLVVEAIRRKHVPVGVEFPWVRISQELELMIEIRLLGLRPDDFQPGPLLPAFQPERAHSQAAAQYARYELR